MGFKQVLGVMVVSSKTDSRANPTDVAIRYLPLGSKDSYFKAFGPKTILYKAFGPF